MTTIRSCMCIQELRIHNLITDDSRLQKGRNVGKKSKKQRCEMVV